MRRLLAVALAGLIVLASHAQQKVTYPALNVGNAKIIVTSPEAASPLTCVAISESKGILIAGCEDGTLLRWKVEADKDPIDKDRKGETIKAHARFVTCCAIGEAVLLTGSTDGKVMVWTLPTDKAAHTITLGKPVRCVAVSVDGKLAAAGGDDKDVQLIDTGTGKVTKKLTGPTDWIQAVAISPDGKFVAAGGHDGKLWMWEAASGKKVFEVLAQQPAAKPELLEANVTYAIAFSPDGKQIALGGSDPRICFFGVDGKFQRYGPGHTGAITGLVYHPDGKTLFSTSKNRSVRAWNPAAGNGLKTLEGHTAWAEGLVLLHLGTKCVSVGADRTARLWELGAPPTPKKK
jgi:WD40 repeat protein